MSEQAVPASISSILLATLNPDEKVVFCEEQPEGKPVFGRVYVLTSQRLLALDAKGRPGLTVDIHLSEIKFLQVCVKSYAGTVPGMLAYQRAITLDMRDGSTQTLLQPGPMLPNEAKLPQINLGLGLGLGKKSTYVWKSDTQVKREQLARKICEVCRMPFCAPYHLSNLPANQVTFYVKSDLVFPQRCAACMKESRELITDRIIPGISNQINLPRLFGVYFDVPYCPECHAKRFAGMKKKRAVKLKFLLDITATLAFENIAYAEAFKKVNSRM